LLDRAASGSGNRPAGAGNGNGNNGNGNGNSHAHHGFSAVVGDVQARLPGVQKVLHMLDMLPAEEPPQDLLGRTLRRLDAEIARHPSALRPPQPELGTGMQQPHA